MAEQLALVKPHAPVAVAPAGPESESKSDEGSEEESLLLDEPVVDLEDDEPAEEDAKPAAEVAKPQPNVNVVTCPSTGKEYVCDKAG